MGDITTTGPVGLKGLTGLSTNNTPDFGLNYKLLSPEETARPYRSPIEVANEAANDNLQSQYDEQMIDTGVTRAKGERTVWDQPEIDDIQNYRAYRQSAVNKLANGAAKAGVLTATTFLNDTIGAVAGLVGMVDGDDETNYWDNPFSRAMKSVNDWSERALPNFYSTEEQEHPFKITANFIGDKVIKNLGFTAGSMLAAGAVGNGVAGAIGGVAERMTANALNKAVATAGKAAKNTTKAARELQKATNFTKLEKLIGANQQIPKLITTGTAALYGAIGEGAFEALNNSDEWLKAEMAKYDNEFTNKENAIVAKYQANKGKGFALNPETGSAIDPAYLEYKHDMENLAAEREQAQQLAKDRARRMGNIDMALNIPILTASNIVQFGKQLSGGFKTSAAKAGQNASRFAGMDIEDAINAARKEGLTAKQFMAEYGKYHPASTKSSKVLMAIKNSAMEGVEEISQSAASSAAGIFEEKRLNREFEYLEAGKDPRLANKQASWFADFSSSLMEGAGETLKDKEAWSEFFVGALTGALGAPAVGAGARNAAIHTTIGANEEKGRKGLTIGWGGGIYGGIKEGMEELAEEEEMAKKAAEVINSPTFQAIYEGKIRHDFFDMKKQEAAVDNDEVAYEMADAKQMAADIAMADKAGQLGVFESAIEHLYDTTPENIQAFRQQFPEQMTDASGHQLTDDEVAKMMNEQKENAMNTIKEFKVAANLVETIAAQRGVELDDETIENLTWQRAAARQYMDKANQHGLKLGEAIKNTQNALSTAVKSYNNLINLYPEIHDKKSEEFKKLTIQQQNALETAWAVVRFNNDLTGLMGLANNESGSMGLGDLAANNALWQMYKPIFDTVIDAAEELGHPIEGAKEQLDAIKQLADSSVQWMDTFNKKVSSAQSLKKEAQKTSRHNEAVQKKVKYDTDAKTLDRLNKSVPAKGKNSDIATFIQNNKDAIDKIGGVKAWVNSITDTALKDRMLQYIESQNAIKTLEGIDVDGDAKTIHEDLLKQLQNGDVEPTDLPTLLGSVEYVNSKIPRREGESNDAYIKRVKAIRDKLSEQVNAWVKQAAEFNPEDYLSDGLIRQASTADEELQKRQQVSTEGANEEPGPGVNPGAGAIEPGKDYRKVATSNPTGNKAKEDGGGPDPAIVNKAEQRYADLSSAIDRGEHKISSNDDEVLNNLAKSAVHANGRAVNKQYGNETAAKIYGELAQILKDASDAQEAMKAAEAKGVRIGNSPTQVYALQKFYANDARPDQDYENLAKAMLGLKYTTKTINPSAIEEKNMKDQIAGNLERFTATPVSVSVERANATRGKVNKFNNLPSGQHMSERKTALIGSHSLTTYSQALESGRNYPKGIETAEDKKAYLEYVRAIDKYFEDNHVAQNIRRANERAVDGSTELPVRAVEIGGQKIAVVFFKEADGTELPIATLPTDLDMKIGNAQTTKAGLAALRDDVLNQKDDEEPITVTYVRGFAGEFYNAVDEKGERVYHTVSEVMKNDGDKNFRIIIDHGNASKDKSLLPSDSRPGMVYVGVQSATGVKPALCILSKIADVNDDYFQSFIDNLEKLKKTYITYTGKTGAEDPSVRQQTFAGEDVVLSGEQSAKRHDIINDMLHDLGISGGLMFQVEASDGQLHDLDVAAQMDGTTYKIKDATHIRIVKSDQYGNIDESFGHRVIPIGISPKETIDELREAFKDNHIGVKDDTSEEYHNMIGQYIAVDLNSLHTINDDVIFKPDAEYQPNVSSEKTTSRVTTRQKTNRTGIDMSNIDFDFIEGNLLAADKVYGSTEMTNQERLEKSIAKVRKMFPQLTDDQVRIVHNGLIRTMDRSGNPIEAYGRFRDGIIEVCSDSPVGTAYHEAFHYVTDTLMDPITYNAMMALGVKKYGINNPMEVEEHLAEDFRDFMNNYDDTSLKGRLRNMFTSLKIMVKGLFSNRMSLDKLFYDIMRGQMDYYNGKLAASVYESEYRDMSNLAQLDGYNETMTLLDLEGDFADDLRDMFDGIVNGEELSISVERNIMSGELFQMGGYKSIENAMADHLAEVYSESLFEGDHANLEKGQYDPLVKSLQEKITAYFKEHPDVREAAIKASNMTRAQRYAISEKANHSTFGHYTYKYINDKFGVKPYMYYTVQEAVSRVFGKNDTYKSAEDVAKAFSIVTSLADKLKAQVSFAPAYMEKYMKGLTAMTDKPLVVMYIDPSMSDGDIARTLIHELTHVTTLTALDIMNDEKKDDDTAFKELARAGISDKQIDALNNLMDYFNKLNDKVGTTNEYGQSSIDEFISEIVAGEGLGQFRDFVETMTIDDPEMYQDILDNVKTFLNEYTPLSIGKQVHFNHENHKSFQVHFSQAFDKYRQRKVNDVLNSEDGQSWMKRADTTIDEIHQLPLETQENLIFCM